MASKALKTCLHDFHLRQGAKMVEFAGWSMPIHYQKLSLIQSHNWTRQKASIFDVSHMLQTTFKGKDSTHFLESIVVGDLHELKNGQSTLSLFTNADGGIIDDTVINKQSKDNFYVVSNAGCAEKDLAHIKSQLARFKGDCKMEIQNLSLIAIQGPKAIQVIEKFSNLDLSKFAFMTAQKMEISSIPVYVSRCGYTGEDGFEISVSNDKVVELTETLLNHPDVEMAGLGARDSLRLEAGLCLYGHDLNENITPVEASLTWTIGKRRRMEGGFLGSDKILAQIKNGCSQKRVGFTVEGAPARENAEIYNLDNELIGKVTSGCPSPILKKNVGMGYVKSGFHKSGTDILIKVRNKMQKGVVTKVPFVQSSYYRIP